MGALVDSFFAQLKQVRGNFDTAAVRRFPADSHSTFTMMDLNFRGQVHWNSLHTDSHFIRKVSLAVTLNGLNFRTDFKLERTGWWLSIEVKAGLCCLTQSFKAIASFSSVPEYFVHRCFQPHRLFPRNRYFAPVNLNLFSFHAECCRWSPNSVCRAYRVRPHKRATVSIARFYSHLYCLVTANVNLRDGDGAVTVLTMSAALLHPHEVVILLCVGNLDMVRGDGKVALIW